MGRHDYETALILWHQLARTKFLWGHERDVLSAQFVVSAMGHHRCATNWVVTSGMKLWRDGVITRLSLGRRGLRPPSSTALGLGWKPRAVQPPARRGWPRIRAQRRRPSRLPTTSRQYAGGRS